MRRYLHFAVVSFLITAGTALAQGDREPITPSGEIQIPSGAAIDRMLDSRTEPSPNKEFSADDAKAIQQMDQRAKRIDEEVMKGICTGC